MSDLTNPNLNGRLFKNAANVEEMQMRRFRRKHEHGYVGNGFWFANYPYMVGAMGAGSLTQTNTEDKDSVGQEVGDTASTSTGMGPSTASASGAAGGSPA